MKEKTSTPTPPPVIQAPRPKCPRCNIEYRVDGGSHKRAGKRYAYAHCPKCRRAAVLVS